MDIISTKQKNLIKLVFVIFIVVAIVYVFKDSLPQILAELKKTSIATLLFLCASSAIYEAIEGWITYSFARKYNKNFTYQMAVSSVYYASFYRVATLGSAGGVAAIHYLHEKGIPVSQGTGFYTLGYALHKGSIALFSMITLAISFPFIFQHYRQYGGLLAAGYGIMLAITLGLIMFCCWNKCHVILIKLARKCNYKGRFDRQVDRLEKECAMMEETSQTLMTSPLFVISILGKNLLKDFFWYVIPFLVLYRYGAFTLEQSLAITSLSIVVSAVIPTPAGIGGTEYVLTMLLAVFVGTGAAGSATLLYRFATFIFPFLVGAVVVLVRRVGKTVKKKQNAAEGR